MTGIFTAIGREGLLFSVKTYIAAVLALWIAMYLDLPRPYWAMATAYIVAQPLAGAVTSKALYRVLGTFVGAAATLVLVPNLVNAPELLSLALALWVGLCLFASLLDRTPRSYTFMLAGYTAAIIGFPSAVAPDAVFDNALARVEEITIGILCSALISRVVFPRHVGPLLSGRIETWLNDAARWADDVLSGRPDTGTMPRDRRRLAAATLDMLALTTHLPYDTTPLRYATAQMRALQQRMTALLPILSGIADQRAALRRDGGLGPDLPPVLADIAGWISSGQEGSYPDGKRLRRTIAGLARDLESRGDEAWTWHDLVMSSLLAQVRELLAVWTDCLRLRRDIAQGSSHLPRRLRAADRYAGEAALHLDTGTALLAGIAATIGVLLCCIFWIATGWQDGANAAMMGAVFCSIFAFMDNPVPVLRIVIGYMIFAIIVAGIYQFAIFPMIDGFTLLVLTMAPFFLFFGALMPTPAWGLFAFAQCAYLPYAIAIQSRLTQDFGIFLNSNIAIFSSVLIATVATAVISSIGVEQSVGRLLRANRADLADLAGPPRRIDTSAFVRRLVDRFGLLVQCAVALPEGTGIVPERVLSELRIGLNIADLQRVRADLPPSHSSTIAPLLQGLNMHFKASLPMDMDDRQQKLLPLIDTALASFAHHRHRNSTTMECLHALVGIRCGLLPMAPDFVATMPSTEREATT